MYHVSKTKIPIWQGVVVMLMLLPTVLFSQITVSNISGSVKDDQGNPVAGAEVVATNIPTGSQYKTVSGKSGLYYIANVNPGGPYRINTTINGKDVVAEIPYINVGEEGVAMLTSDMGGGGTFVNNDSANGVKVTNLNEVVVNSQNIGINKSGPSQSFDKQQISTIPTLKRSVQDFVGFNSYVGSNFNFAGRDGRYNNFTVDGASLNNSFGLQTGLAGGGNMQPISLDAIDQISIMVSPFDIRQSNFTGGAVNLVTKGGTNTVHGSVYGFFRNQNFNGNKVDGLKLTLNKSTYSNYGFNVGGPILKNKLFYFLSFEGEFLQQPFTSLTPTGMGGSNPSIVTTGQLDEIQNYLQTTYGYNTGGYDFSKNTATNYKILARIDWNINSKNKLMVRYNFVQGITNSLPSTSRSPIPSISGTSTSVSSYTFLNTTYQTTNTVQSVVADLKSTINDHLSNQLLFTYAMDNAIRSIPGGQNDFPSVDILNKQSIFNPTGATGTSYNPFISFGTEFFTANNKLKTNTISIQDNFTANLGRHTLLAGVGFDLLTYSNQYMQGSNSYYRYNTWEDFKTGTNPAVFAITYAYPGANPAASLYFGQPYVYIQDEWRITDNFKLMFSIREDIPLYFNKLLANDGIAAINSFLLPNANPANAGSPINLDEGKWPSSTPLFSPRISFVYDVLKDKSLIIRGGAGIFTGRIPFVWMVAQPTNSGTLQYTFNASNPIMPDGFQTDPNYYRNHPFTVGTNTNFTLPDKADIPTSIVDFDRNFKMPQIMRANLAIEYTFAKDFVASIEGLYTKDINQVVMYNVGLKNPTGTFYDDRTMWWDAIKLAAGTLGYTDGYSGSSATNGQYNTQATNVLGNKVTPTSAMYVTNTNKGYGYSFTASITKKFSHNWTAGVAYTFQQYMEISSNTGSQVGSAWNSIPSKNGQNYLALAPSSYSVPHKLVAYATYAIDYAKYFGTSITLSYIGSPQGSNFYGRYSYVYGNDLNGDGERYDLLYVPKDMNDMPTFQATTYKAPAWAPNAGQTITYTPEQQAKDFWTYINNDKYLSSHKGQTTTRNAGVFPWVHQLNLRLLQNFYFYTGKVKHTLQISYEIVNLLNLFSSTLGNYWTLTGSTDYYNSAPLIVQGWDATRNQPKVIYQTGLAANGAAEKYNNKAVIPYQSIASVWQMNIGVRYIF